MYIFTDTHQAIGVLFCCTRTNTAKTSFFFFFWLCIVCFFWVKMRPDLFADGPHFPWKKVSIFRMNTRFFRQLQTEGYDNKKLTKKYCDLICVFFVQQDFLDDKNDFQGFCTYKLMEYQTKESKHKSVHDHKMRFNERIGGKLTINCIKNFCDDLLFSIQIHDIKGGQKQDL